jgi:hypothetical protein
MATEICTIDFNATLVLSGLDSVALCADVPGIGDADSEILHAAPKRPIDDDEEEDDDVEDDVDEDDDLEEDEDDEDEDDDDEEEYEDDDDDEEDDEEEEEDDVDELRVSTRR